MGRRLLQSGDFAGAEAVFRALAQQYPDHPRAIFLLGLSIHKQKRYADALPLLARADAMAGAMPAEVVAVSFPEAPHVSHFLGWCHYYLGDLAGASAAFDAHIATVPDEFDSHFGRAIVAMDQGDAARARAGLDHALVLVNQQSAPQPRERAKILIRLGDLDLQQEQVEAALGRYQEAVLLWPGLPEAWAKVARVLDRLGRSDEAAEARAEQAKLLEALGRAGAGQP